jgi:molecular chaperone DnaJ
MKLKDAYTILELSSAATPEEAKKRYRELAKKHHPDQNPGDATAEAKFKKINEAYQIIQSGTDTEPTVNVHDWGNPFGGFSRDPFRDIFQKDGSPFGSGRRQYYTDHIQLHITLSFKESVEGCKKEVKYSRQTKCPYCQGNGNKPINNGCKTCGGRGRVTTRAQGSVFIQTCKDCFGRSQTAPCNECNSVGVVDTEASVHVSVPAPVVDGNILRLHAMGNFSGSLMGLQDQYTDVFVHLKVIPEPGLRLEGKDVVSDLHISLLEALRGCSKEVKSLDGNKEANVPEMIKNKDEVVLSVGDHNRIKHRVIVNVDYPDNVDKLIEVLIEEGKIK